MKVDKRRMPEVWRIESRTVSDHKSELTFHGENTKGRRVEFTVVMEWWTLKGLIINHIKKLKDGTLNSMSREWQSLKGADL